MITREQVADLQPGDVVELRHRLFPEVTLRGPISASGSRGYDLVLPPVWIRDRSGEPGEDMEMWGTLTVISRAPRPLYVNHPRTEPVPGDVVRDADEADSELVWWFDPNNANGRRPWTASRWPGFYSRQELPARLRLLVDGETGQAVTP